MLMVFYYLSERKYHRNLHSSLPQAYYLNVSRSAKIGETRRIFLKSPELVSIVHSVHLKILISLQLLCLLAILFYKSQIYCWEFV